VEKLPIRSILPWPPGTKAAGAEELDLLEASGSILPWPPGAKAAGAEELDLLEDSRSILPWPPGAEAAGAEELDLLEAGGPGLAARYTRHGDTASWQPLQAQLTLQHYSILREMYSRGLQFYTFFGISTGITRRMIDIGKKITFYFLQNVLKWIVFFAFAF
jgi:hypothetical protein